MEEDLSYRDTIHLTEKKNKYFTSDQFSNRLFDRDTLLICHYDVNFLYVVSLYGKKNEGQKSVWREKVREQFRTEIQHMLDSHFQFHVMTPREHVNGYEILQQNFKEIIGKVFQPYPDGTNGQKFYSLALEKPEAITDAAARQDVAEENSRIMDLLDPYFEIIECKLGEDKRNELKTPAPDGIIYAQENDLALLITKEGLNFERSVELLKKTGKVGIALKMDGATLQLVEGFTKAKYLIIHNKSSRYMVFGFDGAGPKLTAKIDAEAMVTTKNDEDLYLVYNVDTRLYFYLGDLDLSAATQGGKGYHPQLMPIKRLQKE